MPTQPEMKQLVEAMRLEIDEIARAHGATANLPRAATKPAAMKLDELAAQFAPDRIGSQEVEQLRSLQRCLECGPWTVSNDLATADTADLSSQIRKGQAVGDEVTRMLGEAWQIDLELRAEVDSLREQMAEGGDHLGGYVAEQKAVLLEKLLLLLFIALLLEAAKLCLLMVIQLLIISRTLLALAYNTLARVSAALEAAARAAIANGAIVPIGTAPNLDGRLAVAPADLAALQAALAAYRAQVPILNAAVRASNQALADALALLPRCLALQELARRLAARFLEVERKLRPPRVEG